MTKEKKPQDSEGLSGETPVESAGKVVARDVKTALERAKEHWGKAEIAGVTIKNPQQAYENFKFAYDYIKEKLGIDINDIYFSQFQGSIVGESTAGGIEIDPILLMHPAMRLVHAIAHEHGHAGGEVENEGLVEAYVKYVIGIDLMGDGLVKTDKYETAEKNFYEFTRRVSAGKDIKAVVDKIYDLYYSRNYEGIYELYWEKYLKNLSEKKKVEGFNFFFETFPEFDYDRDGQTSLMEPEEM